MRVGLVIYGSLDTLSGGYLYDRMLVEQLKQSGCHVELFVLPWRDYAKHLRDNFDRRWLHRIASAQVDILIQDELNHPSLLYPNRRHHAAPIVSLVHHLRSSELDHGPVRQAIYRQVETLYLNSVDAFLCNSCTTWQTVAALLHTPKPSCVAYPAADHLPADLPSLDLAALALRSRQPGPLRILFVGNIIKRKGLHTVLTALEMLPADTYQLSIVGRTDIDYDYANNLRKRCRIFPPGSVTFLGRLSDAQLALQYRRHHLFALPSYEGFGIVYLEAMRFGLPAIATTAGAAHELITNGENGFLIAPDDAQTLADHLRQLHANREQLVAMSYAAQQRFAHHPTWRQSMAQAVNWLSTLHNPANL